MDLTLDPSAAVTANVAVCRSVASRAGSRGGRATNLPSPCRPVTARVFAEALAGASQTEAERRSRRPGSRPLPPRRAPIRAFRGARTRSRPGRPGTRRRARCRAGGPGARAAPWPAPPRPAACSRNGGDAARLRPRPRRDGRRLAPREGARPLRHGAERGADPALRPRRHGAEHARGGRRGPAWRWPTLTPRPETPYQETPKYQERAQPVVGVGAVAPQARPAGGSGIRTSRDR